MRHNKYLTIGIGHISAILICVLTFFLAGSTNAATVKEAASSEPLEGCIFVEVPGHFLTPDVSALLAQINHYRKEACQEGLPYPGQKNRKLTMDDYRPLKWSGELEWIAMHRAAECSVRNGHTRPNGKYCFSLKNGDISISDEALAYALTFKDNMAYGLQAFYREKPEYDGSRSHYTSMINPSYCYVAVAEFVPDDGIAGLAAVFSKAEQLDEFSLGITQEHVNQKVEVLEDHIDKPLLDIQDNNNRWFTVGEKVKVSTRESVVFSDEHPVYPYTAINPRSKISLRSSNTAVAEIQNGNVLYCKKAGKAAITASLPNGTSTTRKITVKKGQTGAYFVRGTELYRITKVKKEVEFISNHTDAAIIVPDTIKLGSDRYKVTSICDKAFGGNTNLRKIQIGRNVKTIGDYAFMECKNLTSIVLPARVKKIGDYVFYKCKNLKKITIKNKAPGKMQIGKKAFAKSSIELVHVPRGTRKAFKKILYAKALNKNAKVK